MDLEYGQVGLTLGEDSLTLRPTLKAFKEIDKKYGDLRTAIQRVASLNLEAITFVVLVGAGLKESEFDSLQESIFAAGVGNVHASAVEYLAALMNPSGEQEPSGGKP